MISSKPMIKKKKMTVAFRQLMRQDCALRGQHYLWLEPSHRISQNGLLLPENKANYWINNKKRIIICDKGYE